MDNQHWNPRKVDHDRVIARYQELRSLAETGRELGISRERVRQIVNRAGISSARVKKPRPEKPVKACKECGEPVSRGNALYCDVHRAPGAKNKRRYEQLKADPERYAIWREQCSQSAKRRRQRQRERMTA